METIEVWRGQSTTDTDGNPIQGKPVRVGTFQSTDHRIPDPHPR